MLGMEMVRSRSTKEPASAETAAIFERAKDYGLLLGKGGLYGNVFRYAMRAFCTMLTISLFYLFRIKPPMCISKADADFMVDVLDRSIVDVLQNLKK